MSAPTKPRRTASHRPAVRRRRFRHDDLVAVDLFSGFGGLTRGIEQAGFTTIMAANHNVYKVEVHEANHPDAEHWIADLVDPDSSDYHSARDLPAADLLVAGVSCVNHSQANTKKAYAKGLSLFDMEDPEFDAQVTRSERDRATANCVLHYLNSQFFGVGQSRDRYYAAFWDRRLPAPDLEHRPASWCDPCHEVVEAVWSWKTGVPPTGSVRYGKQYNYRCPRCRGEVIPPMTPSLDALDLTNLGTRIGDRKRPLADATMARAERCRQRFAEFPAVLMPAKAVYGADRTPWQPMATQTSRQEMGLLSTGQVFAAHRHNGDGQHLTRPMDTVTSTHEKAVLFAAVDNYQGAPRGVNEPLPTQGGSETLGVLTAGVVPYRKNTVPTVHAEPMPTVTSDQIPGLLTAAGLVQYNQGVDRRVSGVDRPLKTVVADNHMGVLFSGWYKQNGTGPDATAPHPLTDPLGTLTARDTTAILAAEWRAALADLRLEDCYFRMLAAHEIGRGCGFNVDFPNHQGDFIVWGSARDQVDGFGNAVSPPVGAWIGSRLRAVLDRSEAVA